MLLILFPKYIGHTDHSILKCFPQVTSTFKNSSLNGLLGNGSPNQVSLGLIKANWFQWQEDFQKNKCFHGIILKTACFFLFAHHLCTFSQCLALIQEPCLRNFICTNCKMGQKPNIQVTHWVAKNLATWLAAPCKYYKIGYLVNSEIHFLNSFNININNIIWPMYLSAFHPFNYLFKVFCLSFIKVPPGDLKLT